MEQGKRTKESTQGSIQQSGKIGGDFQRSENAPFIEERIRLFDAALERQKALFEKAPKQDIIVSLKDGKQLKGQAFVTTPDDIAKGISKNLQEHSVVAKVTYHKRYDLGLGNLIAAEDDAEEAGSDCCSASGEGEHSEPFELVDMHRPLEGDCTLELLDFEDPLGKQTFWHSSAHILGQALERYYGAHLCIGPPLKEGFYYDQYIGELKVREEDYAKIEDIADKIAKEKQPYQRVILSKQEALEMFRTNPFKVQLISNKVPEGAFTTAYRCGKLIDLCTGPHLSNTAKVKAFKVTKNSAAYWLGKKENDDLQRVYAIAFPQKKLLDEFVKRQEELKERDHRDIGQRLNLFSFHEFSPGCAFFFPDGAHIYNKLQELLRHEYRVRGYKEVITPNLYDAELWRISGHWAKYRENMFLAKSDGDEEHGFKPMNCPGHCLMFNMKQVSYRDLPLRFADFGVLHRNEIKGALSGLTRVRRFQQDDSHIFCRMDQIQEEILGVLDFIDYVYQLFGFRYELGLSTRPENFLGEKNIWDDAEEQLKQALVRFGKPWKIKPKDGAFYGPKIDVQLFDAFEREHQCGTVQLDFQLPQRFNLQYRTADTIEEREAQKKDKEHRREDVPRLTREEQERKKLEAAEEQHQPSSSEYKHLLKHKKQATDAVQQPHQHQQGEEVSTVDVQKTPSSATNASNVSEHESKYNLIQHQLKVGFQRPVIVHRAVIGSFERFLAILSENTAGKWPFWLSPKQIVIASVSKHQNEFAHKVVQRLVLEGYTAHVDDSSHKVAKKVQSAIVGSYHYIGVVGSEEVQKGFVTLSQRDPQNEKKIKEIGKLTVSEIIQLFKQQQPPKSRKEEELLESSVYLERPDELSLLNQQLQNSVYLGGSQPSEVDHETFKRIGQQEISQDKYPHLWRWIQLLVPQQNTKQGAESNNAEEKKE